MTGFQPKYPYLGATDEQINFAEELGIEVPPGIKVGPLGRLISRAIHTSGPTKTQLKLAKKRGVEFPEGTTCALAQVILEEARESQPVTDAQRRLAERLGVAIPDGASMVGVSEMLDEAIDLLTKVVLEAGKVRVGKRIRYQGLSYLVKRFTTRNRCLWATLAPTNQTQASASQRELKVRVAELQNVTPL